MGSGAVIEWAGGSTDGNLKYSTTVTFDNLGSYYTKEDLCRVACLYFVCNLNNSNIIEAYEQLSDMYSWQQKQATVQVTDQRRRTIPVSSVTRVDRAPFVIDDVA